MKKNERQFFPFKMRKVIYTCCKILNLNRKKKDDSMFIFLSLPTKISSFVNNEISRFSFWMFVIVLPWTQRTHFLEKEVQ